MKITFENLLEFTKVQVLLYVAEKLAAQKKRSIYNFACSNLTKDGLKCAVGHLIPQDILEEEFGIAESGPLEMMHKFYPNLNPIETKEWIDFLGAMRLTHDSVIPEREITEGKIWNNPKDFLEDFEEIVGVYLDKPFLREIAEEALKINRRIYGN